MHLYPYLIHDRAGIVSICDGAVAVVYTDLAELLADMPGYALPEGVIGVNYEHRRAALLHIEHRADGSTAVGIGPSASYEAIIAAAGGLAQAQAARAVLRSHPLYQVTDLAVAREVMTRLVGQEFERAAGELTTRWTATERDTFGVQLAEAQAWLADETAATPMLDALLLPEEDKATLCQTVTAHAAALKSDLGRLIGAKRAHLAAIWAADLEGLQTYDVAAGWPA